MKTCPKCGLPLANEERCSNCGTYLIDHFGLILSGEKKLKKLISILSFLMASLLLFAIFIMLILGLPQFDFKNPFGWTYIGIAMFLLLDFILLIALYVHNVSDNVLSGKHQTIFCIVTSLLGLFPVAIPFWIRGRRIRKKLEAD